MKTKDWNTGAGIRRALGLLCIPACLLLNGCDLSGIHLLSWFDANSKGELAYVAYNDVARDEEIFQLITCKEDGSEPRLVAACGDLITYVAWSPDDKRLIYVTEDPNMRNSELFVIGSSGDNKMSLVLYESDEGEKKRYIWAPEWSPDGQWVLYQLVSNDGLGEVYVVNVESKSVRRVAQDAGLFAAHWSPDGRQVIVGTTSGGDVGDIALGEISTLDSDTGEIDAVAGVLFVPFMTLDWIGNTRVMFSSPIIDIPTTEKKLREARLGLYHFDLTSQRFRKIRTEEGLAYFLLSPDRKRILQLREPGDQTADSQVGSFNMVVSDIRGGRARPIGQCELLMMPTWVGNNRIAFVRAGAEETFVVLSLSDDKEDAISLSSILPLPVPLPEKEHDAP